MNTPVSQGRLPGVGEDAPPAAAPSNGDATITRGLTEQLRDHYLAPTELSPGGVFVTEVSQNGNWGAGRRADALYVGFTSTSGRILIGHEIKVSRADWLRELTKTRKADQWSDQCHEWWLVVPTPSIVHDGELPDGWGLMVPKSRGRRFKVVVPARRYADRTPSWETCRSIMARWDTLRANEIVATVRERVDERSRLIEERHAQQQLAGAAAGTQNIRKAADELSAMLGIDIFWNAENQEWGGKDIGLVPELTQLLRDVRTLENARQELVRGWHTPLATLQEVTQRLAEVCDGLPSTRRTAF